MTQLGTGSSAALRNGPRPPEYASDGLDYPEVLTEMVTARRVTEHLSANGVSARQVHRSRGSGDQVAVMTMHRAKGLEFVNVVALLPRPRPRPYETDEDVLLQQRSLEYVAMSRARDELAVVSPA